MSIGKFINLALKPKKKTIPQRGDGDALWVSQSKPELSFSEAIDVARRAVFDVTVPSLNAANNLVRRTWDLNGPSLETRKVAHQALQKFRGARDDKIERLRILKASIAIDALDIDTAVRSLQVVLREDATSPSRMPALLAATMSAAGVLENPWGIACEKVISGIGESEGEFLDLLADKKRRICIVGSSPCEIGKGRGKTIDDHDVVIRFNNFDTSPNFSSDYGTKTTIWARAGGYTDIWRRPYSQFAWVLYSGSDIRLHAFNSADLVECYQHGGRPMFVPARIYSELSNSLNYRPSAGLLISYWLKKLRGAPDWETFSIFGISLDDQQPNLNNQYFANSLKRASYAHNWTAEAAFFKERILE